MCKRKRVSRVRGCVQVFRCVSVIVYKSLSCGMSYFVTPFRWSVSGNMGLTLAAFKSLSLSVWRLEGKNK